MPATSDELDRLLGHIVETIRASERHVSATPDAAPLADDLRRLAQIMFQLVVWLRAKTQTGERYMANGQRER